MHSIVVVLLVALLTSCVFATPNLISRKSVYAATGVQPTVGNDMIVTIDIYNAGDSPAYDVRLDDKWHVDHFIPVSGASTTSWEVIPAGTNVTHTVVLTPTASGYMETRRASIDYRATPNGEDIRSVSTSIQGLRIYEPNEVDWLAYGGSHLKEWFVFLVFSGITVAAPAFFYFNVQQSKEKLTKQD